MKILFIQLPLVDHGYSYIQGNIPYAPAVNSAYIARHFKNAAEAEYLPDALQNWASDDAIAKHALDSKADIVAFTCYLWNVERSLNIARIIKSSGHASLIIFGGPEINYNSWALSMHRAEVDCFVSGEGEWFFERFLNKHNIDAYTQNINRNKLITQPSDELLQADEIIEPFTNGMLSPMSDGSIFIELTRGCPYRCSYCYYSKNFNKVRELPFDTLLKAVDMRNTMNLSEIYILSPTFNKTPDFKRKLETLASLNHGIRLHTEMRADGIDDALAKLIAKAGFTSCEVGLQTLNKTALGKVSRRDNAQAELKGMTALSKSGIKLQIGIIPGLPGDNPESFRNTVDVLVENGFADSIEFYPLMVLPGTRLYDEAVADNADFMCEPPYYLLKSREFSFDDIYDLAKYIEDSTGFSLSPYTLPDFIFHDSGILTRGVSFNGDVIDNWDIDNHIEDIETSVFSFYISLTKNTIFERGITKLITSALPRNTLYNIILESDVIVNENDIAQLAEKSGAGGFYNRLSIFSGDESIKYYQVFSNIACFIKALDNYTAINPVIRVNDTNINAVVKFIEHNPDTALLISNRAYPHIKKILLKYADCTELVRFENESDMADFYKSAGADYISMPFNLRVKKK